METFALAAEAFGELVRRLPANGWDGRGLGDWDLRSLVGHASRSLITVDAYLDRPTPLETITSPEGYYAAIASALSADPAAVAERGRVAGRALGEDPASIVRSLVERVIPRVRSAGDPVIETIAGGMRLSAYVQTRTFELVVHSLDIAAATELGPLALPEAVLAEVATLATRIAVSKGDGADVILALTGRKPLRDGFSVV